MLLIIVLIGTVLLLNNALDGHNISFPVEACKTAMTDDNYVGCIDQLALDIRGKHNWKADTSVSICGIPCVGKIKGRTCTEFQFKRDARFRCPSLAPGIEEHHVRKSRNATLEWAMKDFFIKAFQSGRFKPNHFQCETSITFILIFCLKDFSIFV